MIPTLQMLALNQAFVKRNLAMGSAIFQSKQGTTFRSAQHDRISYQIYRQLSGWFLPPLVVRAFGAHCPFLARFYESDRRPINARYWRASRLLGLESSPPSPAPDIGLSCDMAPVECNLLGDNLLTKEPKMAFFMFTGSYTTDSLKAMVDNPQDREAVGRAMVEAVGAKLHSFFFTFGQSDIIAIIEADDDIAAAAGSLLVGASGVMAHGSMTKLMTSVEAMAAMGRAKDARGSYSPPTC